MTKATRGKPTLAQRADQDAAEAIAVAVGFAAHFRRGPMEVYHVPTDTLAEARAQALVLNAAHGQFGRRAVVYAMTPNNGRIPVPESYAA